MKDKNKAKNTRFPQDGHKKISRENLCNLVVIKGAK